MNIFLIDNGFEIEAAEPEAVSVMMALAAGTLDEAGLVEWLGGVAVPFIL